MELLKKNFEFGGITYLVCSNGDIFGPTGKQLKPRENADGYAVVTMGNKRIRRSTQFVHRVVAELFLPNPQDLSDVDHLDGNRMNPDKDNLEWVTHCKRQVLSIKFRQLISATFWQTKSSTFIYTPRIAPWEYF